jgi:NAD(P)-dependent dehydrogenase (short-subunit alcohol dehydrogenase family)
MGSYPATKAYVDYMSRALRFELSDRFDVLSVRPGEVQTKMTGYRADGQTVESVVKYYLRDLPHESVTNGSLIHEVGGLFIDTFYPMMPGKFLDMCVVEARKVKEATRVLKKKSS